MVAEMPGTRGESRFRIASWRLLWMTTGPGGASRRPCPASPIFPSVPKPPIRPRWSRGLPVPRVPRSAAKEQLSLMLLSFMSESRRLDNQRMVRELGLRLRYPSVAEGLTGQPQR